MPYDVKRFIFSVSLCAMLVANPVLATAPTNDEDLDTTHDVYVESTLNQATNGIAGVSYVNRMVNAAGNAADAAEGHAAAAGAHALSAAQSANEAHEVLKDKVNIDQGADKKNKAMVTDDAGSVYAGYIAPGMIADGAVTPDKLSVSGAHSYSGFLAYTGNIDGLEMMAWRQVGTDDIADSAVTADKIAADSLTLVGEVLQTKSGSSGVYTDWGQVSSFGIMNGAVTANKIANGAVTTDKIAGGAVTSTWIANGAVTTDKIANGAVTAEKIASPSGQSGVLSSDGGVPRWSKIGSLMLESDAVTEGNIANGAVTIDKTAGVVGMVPVGAEGATTYGSFWIE